MREELKGKFRSRSINELRNRVWWASISLLSGGQTAHWIWRNIDKRRTSRSRWYTYPSGRTTPRDDAIQHIAEEWPETAQIFNALFWSALKGQTISEREVVDEFKRLDPLFSCPHPLLKVHFWQKNIHEDPGVFETQLFRTVNEADHQGITLQVMVLVMSLAHDTNKPLWNFMCEAYRSVLPLYIASMKLPFKEEIFDAVDDYVIKYEIQGYKKNDSGKRSWREEIPRVRPLVEEHYTDHFLFGYAQQEDLSRCTA